MTAGPSPLNKLLTGDLIKVMSDRIINAEKSVHLTCYHIRNPYFAHRRNVQKIFTSLYTAHENGINVRILLNYVPSYYRKYIKNLGAARWFHTHNIPVRYIEKNTTMHAKLLIVDSRYFIIGSHNLSPAGLERNIEASVFIDDTRLAGNLNRWFLHYWNNAVDFHKALL